MFLSILFPTLLYVFIEAVSLTVSNGCKPKTAHSVRYCRVRGTLAPRTVQYLSGWSVRGLFNNLIHFVFSLFMTSFFPIVLLHFIYLAPPNKLTMSIRPKLDNFAFEYVNKLNIE